MYPRKRCRRSCNVSIDIEFWISVHLLHPVYPRYKGSALSEHTLLRNMVVQWGWSHLCSTLIHLDRTALFHFHSKKSPLPHTPIHSHNRFSLNRNTLLRNNSRLRAHNVILIHWRLDSISHRLHRPYRHNSYHLGVNTRDWYHLGNIFLQGDKIVFHSMWLPLQHNSRHLRMSEYLRKVGGDENRNIPSWSLGAASRTRAARELLSSTALIP
jgi:hypothetical protein